MYFTKKLRGQNFRIIVHKRTVERLSGKCFRNGQRLAGNFNYWTNVEQVLKNSLATIPLLEHAYNSLLNGIGTSSLSVDYLRHVGWESTDDISKYHPDDLESFNPNIKSVALRVKLYKKHLTAPKTNMVTIAYEVKMEGDVITVIVFTIHPGKNIGVLDGDISSRERVVFFDWNHPGEK